MSSTQKNKINSLITVIGIIFLSIVIALISYDILFGTYSINSNNKISNVVISKEKQLTKINNENAELIEKIDSIKNDDSYVENMAREEFGLIKEGEEYFEIEPE
jgi:cell division protein FtsB|tara:strand:- start:364 stop:675 length:312 start_codon:yes stop_codon:yes gene_type:complete